MAKKKNPFQTISLTVSHASTSQLGELWAANSGKGLMMFNFGITRKEFIQQLDGNYFLDGTPHPALQQVKKYLSGILKRLDVKIDWASMTAFQIKVYKAVIAVPYGQTATYQQIAGEIGQPKAYRAVGSANAANPLPIIIPCHRLVGSDGSLRGYGGVGGIKTKQWLLDLESRQIK